MNARKPNIVFIISDDTDLRLLGCYGGRVPTPHMQRIADRGVLCTGARCVSSVCQPSRVSYLTGQFASRSTDPKFLADFPDGSVAAIEWNNYAHRDMPQIARILSANGYRTGFTGKCHHAHFEDVGLPHIDEDADPDDPDVDAALRETQRLICRKIREQNGFDWVEAVIDGNNDCNPVKAFRKAHYIEWSTQAAVDFIAESKEQPFFLHLGSTCHHSPDMKDTIDADPARTPGGKVDGAFPCMPDRRQLPERVRARGLPVNHDSLGITMLDDQVGAVLNALEEHGLRENTIVIYCGDHGVEPGKASCYEIGLSIPFTVSWPGMLPAGTQAGGSFQNIDLLPTVLAWCEIPVPEGIHLDGQSMMPVLRGETDRLRSAEYFEIGYSRAVRTERWKYIATRYPQHMIDRVLAGEDVEECNPINKKREHCHVAIMSDAYPGFWDADQLYDLQNDPGEQHNLAADPSFRDRLDEMKGLLREKTAPQRLSFPLDETSFFETGAYARQKQKVIDMGLDHIPWWPLTHWDS